MRSSFRSRPLERPWRALAGGSSRHTSRFSMEVLHGDRMQHLDEGTIHAWLDGALSPDEGAAVEQHAQQCAECASLVAEARGMIAGAARIVGALDIVPGGVIPKHS